MSNRKRERVEHTSHKVIEKRRRDRINNCLFELSQAVPAAFSKQTSGKLEKAEILEMTVEYLRAVQTTEIGMRFDNGEWFSTDIWGDFAQHYQTGYSECVHEVVKYMADVEGVALSDTRCARLLSFLHNRFRADSSAQPSSGASHGPREMAGNVLGMAGSAGSFAASSRAGFLAGCAGMVTSASSGVRDVAALKSGHSSALGGSSSAFDGAKLTAFSPSTLGGSSSAFDGAKLAAFSPYLSKAMTSHSSAASVVATGDVGRPPLHPSTSLTSLSVMPPSSSFRPLPPLTIPAVDYLSFPPTVSFLTREPGAAVVTRPSPMDLGKEAFAVGLQSGLGLASHARKDVCSGV